MKVLNNLRKNAIERMLNSKGYELINQFYYTEVRKNGKYVYHYTELNESVKDTLRELK